VDLSLPRINAALKDETKMCFPPDLDVEIGMTENETGLLSGGFGLRDILNVLTTISTRSVCLMGAGFELDVFCASTA
jgi:hypothetical protein